MLCYSDTNWKKNARLRMHSELKLIFTCSVLVAGCWVVVRIVTALELYLQWPPPPKMEEWMVLFYYATQTQIDSFQQRLHAINFSYINIKSLKVLWKYRGFGVFIHEKRFFPFLQWGSSIKRLEFSNFHLIQLRWLQLT